MKDPYTEYQKNIAITQVQYERQTYEDAIAWVTDRVGMRMRMLIREFRKNYWGVYNQPYDEDTGRDKLWFPLTQGIIEDIVKNTDLDTKDISYRAKNPSDEAYIIAKLARYMVKDYLDKTFFGKELDETNRQHCIDGTAVWKTWEENGKMMRRTVDLLNFYIDPTEESIYSAYRVTERAVVTIPAVEHMSGWFNTQNLKGSRALNKTDGKQYAANLTTGDHIDVWETWGKFPKSIITSNEKDTEEIDAHVVVSGLQSGTLRVHLIEENKNIDEFGVALKPYEEFRSTKISGRWYGLGFAERMMALQQYQNIIGNVRINKNIISQLGIFQVRKGAGISPQEVSRIVSNGAIPVTALNTDIAPLQVPTVDNAAYQEENVIKSWAQQITQAYPISTGEPLPASTSATQAAIQNTASKGAYSLVKDAFGNFLTRWLNRHAFPIIVKDYKKGDILKILGDQDGYSEIVEAIVATSAIEALNKSTRPPSEEEFATAMQAAKTKLQANGQLFIKLEQKALADNVEAFPQITNEDLDTSVTVTNLIQALQIAPEQKEEILPAMYDLLGLNIPFVKQKEQPQQPQGQMPQSVPTPLSIQQNAVTQ